MKRLYNYSFNMFSLEPALTWRDYEIITLNPMSELSFNQFQRHRSVVFVYRLLFLFSK